MLQFKQNDTSAQLILTLTENVSISVPYYLFVFTHVLTRDQVKFIKSVADDESGFQSRYNEFNINPSILFEDRQPGEWHYAVYEQASSSNTNMNNAGALLENGKMILSRSADFEFNKYNSPTSFKTYNG